MTIMIPPLAWFCLHRLKSHPLQVHISPLLPHRHNLLQSFLLTSSSISDVDPLLWAVLIQIYDALPPALRIYPLSLIDTHLLTLQHVPNTSSFSLLTVLELPSCPELTDNAIFRLRDLHSLCAFNAARTALTPYGIKTLSAYLHPSSSPDTQHVHNYRGPWALRILSLRGCTLIDNDVFQYLAKFVLLCVIDIRGTQCNPSHAIGQFKSAPEHANLFYPTPPIAVLNILQALYPSFYSSQNSYFLHVKTFRPLNNGRRAPVVAPQDGCFVLSRQHRNETTTKNTNKYDHCHEKKPVYDWWKTSDIISSEEERQRKKPRLDDTLAGGIDPSRFYSNTAIYKRVAREQDDEHETDLMLFRTPVGWEALEKRVKEEIELEVERRGKEKEKVGVVVVKRGGMAAAKIAERLLERRGVYKLQ